MGRFERVLLVILLCLSVGLVGYRLPEQGLIDADDFVYYRSAVADLAVAKWVVAGKSYPLADHLRHERIFPESNWYGKPLWHLLSMAAILAVGDRDWSLLLASALFVPLLAAAMFALVRRLYGARAALLALLFLVTSPVILRFGRTGLAHMPQLFFFVLGADFYLRGEADDAPARLRTAAGTCMGLAILTHLSAVPYVGLFFARDAYRWLLRERRARAWLVRATQLGAPIVLVVLVTDLAHRGFREIIGPEGRAVLSSGYGGYMSYFEQVRFNLFSTQVYGDTVTGRPMTTVLATAAATTRLYDTLRAYVYDPWVYEGSARAAIMFVALVALLRSAIGRREPHAGFLAVLIVVPYGVFLVWSNPDIRTVLTSFLFMSVAVGLLAERWRRRVRDPRLVTLILGIVALYMVYNLRPLYETRSGFKQATEWLRARGVHEVVVLNTGVHADSFMALYGIESRLARSGEIGRYRATPFVIVSVRDSLFNPPGDRETVGLATKLLDARTPLFLDTFRPAQHAFDRARREHSFVVDRVLTWMLGRNFRRQPIPVAIFDTEAVLGVARSESRQGA